MVFRCMIPMTSAAGGDSTLPWATNGTFNSGHMKTTMLVLIACLALTWGARGAEAQKVATINLRKVFESYYRTKQADATLKEQAAELEKETKTMLDEFHKREEKYKKLLDGANDQALSQ